MALNIETFQYILRVYWKAINEQQWELGQRTQSGLKYTLLYEIRAYRLTEKYSNFQSQLYYMLFAIANSIKFTRPLKAGPAKMILPGFNPKAQTQIKQEMSWHWK